MEARKKTPFEVGIVVPSILQELAQSPELLDFLSKNMSHLAYAGGDLPQALGDIVASKIRLMNRYGATEVGLLSLIQSKTNHDPLKDWRYINFHPGLGVEMRQVTDDEYQFFFNRTPEQEGHQVPFGIFPELQEFSTKDLFVRHPDPKKPNLWRWSARADDVIVFLNGEKTNPVSMEQHVTASNLEVSAALVAGVRRFQASLIVELADTEKELDPSERSAVIEKIWPSIEEANAVCPAHARIAKTHILFTKPGKPMPRASKGTVQRAAALAAYASELDALYADADRLSEADSGPAGPGHILDAPVIADFIRKTLLSITEWSQDQLSDEVGFFDLGFDSLQAITATRRLKRGLDFPGLTPTLIYLNPSVSSLTEAVVRARQNQESSTEAKREAQLHERDSLLEEFRAQINPGQSHTVVLTGSTGRLGSHLLDTLLKNPSVAHVHCLNRATDSLAVQRQKFDSFGLENQLDSSRVSFWTVNLTQKDLGVSSEVLQKLKNTATLVIHNAWAVNFNLSLPSFKPQLSSVTNLINFCSSAPKSPHLFFISSISSMLGQQTSDLTPEAIIKTSTPAPNGYANSKYIAEQLLDHAARNGTVRASVARVGQVAGAARTPGPWNKTEWFPSLVLSSLHVGAVPDDIGRQLDRIDWMPVDLLAEVLTELALVEARSKDSAGATVSHPVNVHVSTWKEILPVVVDALSRVSGKPVTTIPSKDWLQRVRKDLETSASDSAAGDAELQALLEKNPAAKLLSFFEDIMSGESEATSFLDTKLTAQRSEKLRAVEGVKKEWIEKWVGEWM